MKCEIKRIHDQLIHQHGHYIHYHTYNQSKRGKRKVVLQTIIFLIVYENDQL